MYVGEGRRRVGERRQHKEKPASHKKKPGAHKNSQVGKEKPDVRTEGNTGEKRKTIRTRPETMAPAFQGGEGEAGEQRASGKKTQHKKKASPLSTARL